MSTPVTLADSPVEQASDVQYVNLDDASSSPPGPRVSWRSRLPPLPQQRSPLVRSSSPRYHSSASSSTAARPTTGTANPPSPSTLSTPHQQRRRSPPQQQTRLRDGDFDFPTAWGDDRVDDVSLVTQVDLLPVSPGFPSDGQDLNDLIESEFSSPSSYPSFLNPPAGMGPQADQAHSQPQLSAAPPRRSSVCDRTFAAPSRSTTQLSTSSVGESQNTLFTNEFGEELLSSESTQSSFTEMPPPRLRDTANAPEAAPIAKRRRLTEKSNGVSKPLALPQSSDDDVFSDNILDDADLEELTTIDLTEATGVLEELKKPQVDNRIKISAFQCVICMDDVSTLTVTHCGHLYCQQCLHSSLHVDATRGKCPMCRAKIDMKPRASYNTKTKGFWPLELKLMTAAKKGKRKADDLS